MEIAIRPALPQDAAALGRVHHTAWLETYTGLLPDSYLAGRSAEKSAAMFARTGCRDMILAQADGETVGFCSWFKDRADPALGEIGGLYLLAAYQGKGIGRQLLEHGLTALREAGYRAAALWVLDTNRKAIGFYEAMGLRPTGETKQADLGQIVTELRYQIEL